MDSCNTGNYINCKMFTLGGSCSEYSREYNIGAFWVHCIALIVVGIIGILGSILSIITLCGSEQLRKHVFYQLLVLLAFFDLLFVVFYGIDKGMGAVVGEEQKPMNEKYYHISYLIINTAF